RQPRLREDHRRRRSEADPNQNAAVLLTRLVHDLILAIRQTLIFSSADEYVSLPSAKIPSPTLIFFQTEGEAGARIIGCEVCAKLYRLDDLCGSSRTWRETRPALRVSISFLEK